MHNSALLGMRYLSSSVRKLSWNNKIIVTQTFRPIKTTNFDLNIILIKIFKVLNLKKDKRKIQKENKGKNNFRKNL